MVIEGVSFPSLKRVSLSIFAYGSLGFGSLGVPSTLAHFPMVLSHPTMLFKTQQWSYRNNDVRGWVSRLHLFKHQVHCIMGCTVKNRPCSLTSIAQLKNCSCWQYENNKNKINKSSAVLTPSGDIQSWLKMWDFIMSNCKSWKKTFLWETQAALLNQCLLWKHR